MKLRFVVLTMAFLAGLLATADAKKPQRRVVKTRLIKVDGTPARAGHKAFVDPKTKKLREPTPDEAAAVAATPSAIDDDLVLEREYSDGSRSVLLGESHMVDVIATIGPDGSISTTCAPRNARQGKAGKDAPVAPALETK